MKKKPDPLLLIDADVLAYQSCAGAEKVICFDEDICTPVCNLSDAIAAFEYKLSFIQETLNSKDYLLCFSDNIGNNFRKALFQGYKSNRDGKAKPVALKFLRDHIIHSGDYKVKTAPTLEADDIMGILATMHNGTAMNNIIVSIDKDLKTIPGKFFDLGHPDNGIIDISVENADYWFMVQALIGDTTDGYGGCPKVGPATAAKLLSAAPEKTIAAMWPIVVQAYEKAGFGEDYVVLMARMARILRWEDYDFENRKVKLWVPPTEK